MHKFLQYLRSSKPIVFIPFSSHHWEILKLLEKEGYLQILRLHSSLPSQSSIISLSSSTSSSSSPSFIEVSKSQLLSIKSISVPSRRVYKNYHSISSGYKQGLGRYIFKTSSGYLTDLDALKFKIGGELLFKIF